MSLIGRGSQLVKWTLVTAVEFQPLSWNLWITYQECSELWYKAFHYKNNTDNNQKSLSWTFLFLLFWVKYKRKKKINTEMFRIKDNKEFGIIFWKLYSAKVTCKSKFISSFNIILAFIWGIEKANVYMHCQKVRIELVEPSKSVWGFDTFIVDIYWLLVIDIQNKSDWNVKLFF